jgi:two-component system nitrate/nitrite response regulator NarL
MLTFLSEEVIKLRKVRILVAEDIEPWRQFISSTLLKEPSFEIICEVVDGLQAVQMAEQHQPTIALMDIGLPRLCGLDAARSIKRLAPNTAIIFLSGLHDMEIVQTAMSLGNGYVLKSDAASDLIAAIHSVAAGETFVSRQLAGLGIVSKRDEA